MLGFLNVNKPKGITSFDVIFRLRKILKIKKMGHAGTLDPLASGVLPVAIGDATRLIEYLDGDKKYIATVKFGQSSTTYDEEGEKTEFRNPCFSKEELLRTLETFKGEILQKPPVYSAIKKDGKRLYELARKGEEISDIPARPVIFYEINLLDFTLPFAKIEVRCSSGTYVRSFANDLGTKLGCGAYLSDLVRTMACGFDIEDSIEIEEADITKIQNPLEILNFPKLGLSDTEFQRVKNGNSISHQGQDGKILLTHSNKMVSIGTLSDNIIKTDKVFRTGE